MKEFPEALMAPLLSQPTSPQSSLLISELQHGPEFQEMRTLVTLSRDLEVNGWDFQILEMQGKAEPLSVRGKGISVSQLEHGDPDRVLWSLQARSVCQCWYSIGRCDIVLLLVSGLPSPSSALDPVLETSPTTQGLGVSLQQDCLEGLWKLRRTLEASRLPGKCSGLLPKWPCPPLKCAFS